MLKQEFIDSMQTKLGKTTKKKCEEFLCAFEQAVYDALKRGEEVRIAGFGTFKTRKISAHEGTNPQSGEKMMIEESVVPFFTAGSDFKRAVRN